MPFAYGLTLEGGVTYTVESARKEAFEGVKYKIPVSSFKEHLRDRNFAENKAAIKSNIENLGDRLVELFSDSSYGVTYLKNVFNTYFYNKEGKLKSFEVRLKLGVPSKRCQYNSKGELEGIVFVVAERESFIYKKNGELEAHWIGNNCYDEKGKLVLTRF